MQIKKKLNETLNKLSFISLKTKLLTLVNFVLTILFKASRNIQ